MQSNDVLCGSEKSRGGYLSVRLKKMYAGNWHWRWMCVEVGLVHVDLESSQSEVSEI